MSTPSESTPTPTPTPTDAPTVSTVRPGQSLVEAKNTADPYRPSDLFLEQKVRVFRSTDFVLGTKTPIALRYDDCILILFYNDMNREDRDVATIWQESARLGSLGIFAAVNLRNEPAIAEAINQIKMDPNNPLYDFAPKGIPAIVVYRNQYPQAFYNGPREVQSIVDYALTLACDANYREREQKRYGADTNTLQVPGSTVVRQPRSSTDFILGQGLRQYGIDYGTTTIPGPVSGTTESGPGPGPGPGPSSSPAQTTTTTPIPTPAPAPIPIPTTTEEEGQPGATTSEQEEGG